MHSKEKGFYRGPRAHNPNGSNQILNTLYMQLSNIDPNLKVFYLPKMLQEHATKSQRLPKYVVDVRADTDRMSSKVVKY
jgi:hypothetical protein